MTGMTPERLGVIRRRISCDWVSAGGRYHRDACDLLAEVDRLRAGIEALHRPVEIEPSGTICGHCSWQLPNGRFFGQVVEWPCETAALLNPTEQAGGAS